MHGPHPVAPKRPRSVKPTLPASTVVVKAAPHGPQSRSSRPAEQGHARKNAENPDSTHSAATPNRNAASARQRKRPGRFLFLAEVGFNKIGVEFDVAFVVTETDPRLIISVEVDGPEPPARMATGMACMTRPTTAPL